MIVQTKNGTLQGIESSSGYAFKGIPYAQPPTGKLRFLPPADFSPWEGVLDCTQYRHAAPQVLDPRVLTLKEGEDPDEDCLYLNVFTPSIEPENLKAVLFYIHGGAFQMGSGAMSMNPDLFTSKDVLVVSANYRLGALGFAQLDHLLGPEYLQSGNCGMLDIIKALEWVQENIRLFGGDPSKVTLMGQSAGSKMVASILMAQKAKGLFSGAIMQSGSTQCIRDLETARVVGSDILKACGLKETEADKLLTLPWEDVVKYQKQVISGMDNLHTIGPVFDTVNFQGDDALEIIKEKKSSQVPMILGTNRDEMSFFYHLFDMKKLDRELADKLFGSYSDYALEQLLNVKTEGEFIKEMSDYLYRNSTVQMADAFEDVPMYMYRIDYDLLEPLKAAHGLDMVLITGESQSAFTGVEKLPGFQELAEEMRSRWIAFIKTGSPNDTSLPEWPKYSKDHKHLMCFDRSVQVTDVEPVSVGPHVPHCLYRR